MHNNVLVEPLFVENYYTEYLKQINTYSNLNRQSIFCRYFNINMEFSSYSKDDQATFDRYNSGIRYDTFDYTPLFYVAQLVNDTADQQDLIGQMFQGSTNVITYTIKKPRVEDLISFSYKPHAGEEIFRVTNVRTALHVTKTTPALNWYELTLEYAPIINISRLNIMNKYAYSLSLQKYMFSEDFKSMIQYVKIMEKHFENIQRYFNNEHELYTVTINIDEIDNISELNCVINCNDYEEHELFKNDIELIGNCTLGNCSATEKKLTLVPLYINQQIYNFLANSTNYNSLFFTPDRPFGIKKFKCIDINDHFVVETKKIIKFIPKTRPLNEIIYDPGVKKYITTKSSNPQSSYNTLNYNFNINLYDLSTLMKTWELYYKTNRFPDIEDIDYNNAFYLTSKNELLYKDSKPTDIQKMI